MNYFNSMVLLKVPGIRKQKDIPAPARTRNYHAKLPRPNDQRRVLLQSTKQSQTSPEIYAMLSDTALAVILQTTASNYLILANEDSNTTTRT